MKKTIAVVSIFLILCTPALALEYRNHVLLGVIATSSIGAIAGAAAIGFGGVALAPFLVPAGVIVAGATGVAMLYEKPSNSASADVKVSPTGDVSVGGDVVMVELGPSAGDSPVVKSDSVDVKLPLDKMRELANKKTEPSNPNSPDKYPKVKAAINKTTSDALDMDKINGTAAVATIPAGTVVKLYEGKGFGTVGTGYFNQWYSGSSAPAGMTSLGSRYMIAYGAGNGANPPTAYAQYIIPFEVAAAPPTHVQPKTPVETASGLAKNTVSGEVLNDLDAEIDAMLADPDYVPTFSDATTGLPYAPPLGLPSQAQIVAALRSSDAAVKDQALRDAMAAALASQTGIAGGSQAGSDAAKAAYIASGGSSTGGSNGSPIVGTGGDAGLLQKYKDAQGQADKDKAALDKLKSDQAAYDAAKAKEDAATGSVTGVPSNGAAYGDGINPDFGARLSSFLAGMKSSSVFGAPSAIMGSIPGGGSSLIHVSFGRMGSTDFDFASWGSAINLIRVLALFSFSLASLKIITLKGGGA